MRLNLESYNIEELERFEGIFDAASERLLHQIRGEGLKRNPNIAKTNQLQNLQKLSDDFSDQITERILEIRKDEQQARREVL
jgi:hypothetical protein